MTRSRRLTVEACLVAWPHGNVKNADGGPPASMLDFTLHHSRSLGEAWGLLVYSLMGLVFFSVLVLFIASLPSALRGASTFERCLLLSFLVLWCLGCFMFSATVFWTGKRILYNRAFHPPLLLSGERLHVGAHVHFSYAHQRKRWSDHREGFSLSQLVAATHAERTGEYDPYPAFEALWSSDVRVTPITRDGAVSFEQDFDLGANLPGTGPVARSDNETLKEVVWYMRIKEVVWPRSACTYEFVLPVGGAPAVRHCE